MNNKISKYFSGSCGFILFCILSCNVLGIVCAEANAVKPERIVYTIKPLGGRAEYTDYGLVNLEGKEVNKSTFHTRVLGFDDTETIYSLQQNSLPLRVERDIKKLIGGEYIIEEYDQVNFSVTITKYKRSHKVSQLVFRAKEPIYNAVFLMFRAAQVSGLKLGWSRVFFVPNKFEVTLTSIDKIKIRDKIYTAYHFNSQPDKFEFWVDSNQPHIPLKIKGKGDFKYTFNLKEYSPAVVK
ncbi:MAG: hypothetical protein WCY09_04590 [Candidatus Omnitrophota bacterium]